MVKLLKKLTWKDFILAAAAFVFIIVQVWLSLTMPDYMSEITKLVQTKGSKMNDILIAGGKMLACALGSLLAAVCTSICASKISSNFSANLRGQVFHKVQSFSMEEIGNFSTASLITRSTNDITQVQNLINMALRMMLRAPGMLIGALIMAFVMNAELAVIVLIVIPILVGAIAVLIKIAFPKFKIMQKKLDALNSNIQEMLTNVRVIKSFVRGDYEEKKFAASNEDLKQTSLGAFKTIIIVMPLMMLMMNATTLAVVWFGGRQIIVGNMQVGDLTAFTTYIVQILMSLMMLAMVILQSSRALASLSRIREILDTEVDLNDENCKEPDKIVSSGRVEFRDVSFRYYKENKEAVLSHISFAVKSGQTLGIIGSTGSGKTTLVQMIPRLYDVDEGEVLVDGVNVKDYTLENLREGVGMVLQKNVLFSGSILENLMWGDENASIEEVRKAAQAAQADGFVSSFTGGYEMDLGQGGVNVSGGQKQRLCIARALLKKPKILILDDSTSAVDTATEAKIRESFAGELKNTTKIIIAQRISSVQEADEIMVLDDGKIVGFGKHEDLLASCEAYQEIYYSQMDKEKEGAAP